MSRNSEYSLQVIAASLIEIAGYLKMSTRADFAHDEMGFFKKDWNREVEEAKDRYYSQLSDAVDCDEMLNAKARRQEMEL